MKVTIKGQAPVSEVWDGRARDLGIEKEGTFLGGFFNQESNGSKHGDAAMYHLSFTVAFKSLLISLLGKRTRWHHAKCIVELLEAIESVVLQCNFN